MNSSSNGLWSTICFGSEAIAKYAATFTSGSACRVTTSAGATGTETVSAVVLVVGITSGSTGGKSFGNSGVIAGVTGVGNRVSCFGGTIVGLHIAAAVAANLMSRLKE